MQSPVKAEENTAARAKENTEENMEVSEEVNIIDKRQIQMNTSG